MSGAAPESFADDPFAYLLPEGHGYGHRVRAGETERLHPLLPSERSPRESHWVDKRRREYHAGRHAARELLLRVGHGDHPIVPDADGVPIFPSDWAGSITHTGRSSIYAAAVLGPELAGLGLDAEESQIFEAELRERILGEDEEERLARWDDRPTNAVLVFSAKEAFYKCVYPRARLFLGFLEVEFTPGDVVQVGAERRGSFSVRSEKLERAGGPGTLAGRFVETSSLVLSVVDWKKG